MTTVPASHFAQVTPNVLAAGGSGLDLIGLILTNNTQIPIGSILSFASAADVGTYFGSSSTEKTIADKYFAGFDNSNTKPGAILFTQYNESAVAAYLRGGDVSAALTLTQLKALPASVIRIVSDGVEFISGSIDFSAATSFSNAAAIIEAAFTIPTFTVTYDSISGAFVFTNTTTGATSTSDYAQSETGSATACTSLGTVLTVGGTVTGTFNVGDVVYGTDTTNSLPANTTIVNQLTGTPGGAGTYTISAAAAPGNLTSCTVVSVGPTGAMGISLLLTEAYGAVLSQGADAAVPGTFMDAVTAQTTNWATFMTSFDPDTSGNANKLLFATWVNAQNYRYGYVCRDTDITPTQSSSATTSLGALLAASDLSGTVLIYEPAAGGDLGTAAFICGAVASVDYNQTQGNVNFAYRSQTGLTPGVTNETVLTNLTANGYNAYVAAATANQDFNFFYDGRISGPWSWMNTFFNQIWLNNQFQLDLMLLLTQVKSIPYNSAGYAQIYASLLDTIQAAVNFGAIQQGVTLSSLQKSEVNTAAGTAIDSILNTRGWYLKVKDATPTVRQNRASPPCTFWYTDGGSVNKIDLASVDLQ